MTLQQVLLLLVVSNALVFFLWGKWRYDLVALFALLVSAMVGIVPLNKVFSGFGHPAVFMVISVLIVSHAMVEAGATEAISKLLYPVTRFLTLHIFFLCCLGAFLSAFINNVGALALLMPVALKTGLDRERSAGILLMPLSFATILGGLITAIGTPPNIIISKYRMETLGTPFDMFDFSPIGLLITLGGILFISLIGWRLIPRDKREKKPHQELFEIDNYVIQAKAPAKWSFSGTPLPELEEYIKETDVSIVGLSRGQTAYQAIPRRLPLAAHDVFILEGEQKNLSKALDLLKLQVLNTEGKKIDLFQSTQGEIAEVVVSSYSSMVGKNISHLKLQRRYGINLLGVSRQGKQHRGRLDSFKLGVGDILLLQGAEESLKEMIATFNCLPLAERDLTFQRNNKIILALGIFAAAIAASLFRIIPLHIALPLAAIGMVVLNIIPIQKMYERVDWPIVILIGSMIPIGEALDHTGTATLIVEHLIHSAPSIDPVWIIATILIVTMTVSDILNNAATAVLMAPIAYNLATHLNFNPDAFLMAVTVGASSAFLTPIGHQNNAMIMGPGGYEFKDYWRMGLPLEILIVLIATPAILYFWPL